MAAPLGNVLDHEMRRISQQRHAIGRPALDRISIANAITLIARRRPENRQRFIGPAVKCLPTTDLALMPKTGSTAVPVLINAYATCTIACTSITSPSPPSKPKPRHLPPLTLPPHPIPH